MSCTATRWTSVAIGLALSIVAATASAGSAKAEAEQHFKAGNALVENEDYAAAIAEFELSVRLYPTKMGLFNLANAYKAQNRYGDALEALSRLERDFAGKLGGLAVEVQTLKSTIEGMVGRLDVKVDRDGATIVVDGAQVGTSPLAGPLVVAPGDRAVEARLAGFVTASQTVRIAARGRTEVAFALEEEAAPPPAIAPVPAEGPPAAAETAPAAPASAEAAPAPQPAPPEPPALPKRSPRQRAFRGGAWASFIVGVASGLASGAIYGVAATMKDDFKDARDDYNAAVEDLESDGPSVAIAADGQRAWSDMEDAREAGMKCQKAGLGFAIGAGVLVAAATALFLADHYKEESAEETIALTAAPGGVALEF
ncbi:MAG: PEGA domain-containing protein [Proteobacteria bacterium]|jgi:tetratricopeptide (TPR) repeat protein|nr:PEGA domain-containing protein [Pseudomonadota bacterium]